MEEIWEPIEGFNDAYEVSNLGRVMHEHPNSGNIREMKPQENKGFSWVKLNDNGKRTNRSVHHIVARAFLDNPNGFTIVHHINGNTKDNRLANLEYVKSKKRK